MATLDQVFQREKAWIAACEDVDALIDKIGDWRDSAREAEVNTQPTPSLDTPPRG